MRGELNNRGGSLRPVCRLMTFAALVSSLLAIPGLLIRKCRKHIRGVLTT